MLFYFPVYLVTASVKYLSTQNSFYGLFHAISHEMLCINLKNPRAFMSWFLTRMLLILFLHRLSSNQFVY